MVKESKRSSEKVFFVCGYVCLSHKLKLLIMPKGLGYFRLLLTTFGYFWLLFATLTTFGYFWLLLATFGYYWLLLATFGYFWLQVQKQVAIYKWDKKRAIKTWLCSMLKPSSDSSNRSGTQHQFKKEKRKDDIWTKKLVYLNRLKHISSLVFQMGPAQPGLVSDIFLFFSSDSF